MNALHLVSMSPFLFSIKQRKILFHTNLVQQCKKKLLFNCCNSQKLSNLRSFSPVDCIIRFAMPHHRTLHYVIGYMLDKLCRYNCDRFVGMWSIDIDTRGKIVFSYPDISQQISRHFDAESYPDDDQSKHIEISAFENHIVLVLIIPLQPTTRTTFGIVSPMCVYMLSHKTNEKITFQPK